MAKNNETTTKFKVDISELKKSMQEAKKQVAYANSEFKAVSSSMDDWSKSSDGISAKLKQLNSNLKSQENILNEYEKTLEEVKKEYGENSKEALDYATKLNNQQAVVNKIKREIAGYEDALTQVSKAEKTASKTGQDVADVLNDVGDEAEDAGDGFTVLKGAVATFAGNALTSLVDGLKNGISSLMGLADETREYREDLAKLETAFTTAGFTTEEATKVYKDFYAVLGEEDRSVEAVNHLAKLVDSEKDLQTWTDICTGVWATFGDSLPIEGLTEASNETAKTGHLTGVLADALNWAGVSEDEFQAKLDGLSTEQERQALITETLNGLYSETADEYRKNNASVMEANKAQSDYTDTLAEMGERIEPVMTTVKKGVTELLQEFLKLVGDVDIEAFTTKIEEAFGVLKDNVLPAVKDGLGWILDNKDAVIAGLAGIATGFLAFKVVTLIQGVQKAMQGMTVAQYALNLAMSLNPIGIIISLIAGLVVAFVTLWNKSDTFREFWLNLWEGIKNAVSVAKDWIGQKIEAIGKFFTETLPNFFSGLIDWVKANWQSLLLMLINPFAGLFKYFYDNNTKFKEFVDNAIIYIKELPSKVWTWLVNTINNVITWRNDMIAKAGEMALSFINKVIEFIKQLPEKIWTWLTNVITKVVTWGTNLASKGKEAGQKLMDSLIEKVKEIPDKMLSIGSDIVKGLWNGISDATQWLKDKISGFVGDVTGWLKEKFEIGSPSKLMAREIGKWLPAGVAVGIDDNAKTVMDSMKNLAIDTVGSARAGLQRATTTLGSNGTVTGGVVNNFVQNNYSPKTLSRLDIYRQSKNLLGYAGGGF